MRLSEELFKLKRWFYNIANYYRWEYRYRFCKEHKYNIVNLDVPPDYYECDTRIELALFEINKVFFDVELKHFCESHIECSIEEHIKQSKQLSELYEVHMWYKNEYRNDKDIVNESEFLDFLENENKLDEKIKKMLNIIIKNRGCMWT